MNILLIQPAFKKTEKAYPLGISQLGAVLKGKGHKVFAVDLSFVGLEEVKNIMTNEKIDIVSVSATCYGISLICYSLSSTISLAREVKRSFPLPVVINGPYAAAFKEDLLRDYRDCFDYLIAGGSEYVFPNLIAAIEGKAAFGSVKNLIYYSENKIVSNDVYSFEDDFGSLPFSDRELFPLEKYQGMFTKRKRYTQIITSRGCNRQCSYCPEPKFCSGWSGRSVESVVKEIKLISERYGIKEFHFEDANFFGGGTDRVKDFCQRIIESGLKVVWQCPNGIPPGDISDLSVFSDMAKAGCYSICLGVESFDKNLQKSMDKACKVEPLKKIVAAARKEGIEVTGYFMIGLPGQDSNSVKADIKLSRRIGFDFINYTIFYPYPGSLWYSQYAKGMNINEISKNNDFVSGIGVKALRRLRMRAYLLNSFKLRTLKFALKSFLQVKLPLRFLRRVIGCVFDRDLKY